MDTEEKNVLNFKKGVGSIRTLMLIQGRFELKENKLMRFK